MSFLLAIYAATLFLSAALMFLVQPMFGKMVLPLLGGSPAVWKTQVVFCQSLLLLGYLYTHVSSRWLGIRRQAGILSIIFVFFFLDLFDTVGTLIGVTQEAGLLAPDGSLPRARWALLSDAVGTTAGALLGTSTVTSYIESASGVSAGARTGLANMLTGTLFLLAIFFTPLVKMIGGGMDSGEGLVLYPVVAPALIMVGCLMLRNVKRIDWDEISEAIPAFLTILMMPLTFSITEGIAFGFISYTLLKTVEGRFKEVPALISIFAGLFVLRYIFLPH